MPKIDTQVVKYGIYRKHKIVKLQWPSSLFYDRSLVEYIMLPEMSTVHLPHLEQQIWGRAPNVSSI